jgi:hypothetical protein
VWLWGRAASIRLCRSVMCVFPSVLIVFGAPVVSSGVPRTQGADAPVSSLGSLRLEASRRPSPADVLGHQRAVDAATASAEVLVVAVADGEQGAHGTGEV